MVKKLMPAAIGLMALAFFVSPPAYRLGLRLPLIAAILFLASWLMKRLFENRSALASWTVNGGLLLFVLLVLFFVAELVFMFVPRSHGVGNTLGAKLWMHKYWKPLNESGYRDVAYKPGMSDKVVVVLGDSFAAGHGIKNVENRFSDLLRKKVGSKDYKVINMAKNGFSTKDELKVLGQIETTPNILILYYFVNDIEDNVKTLGTGLDIIENAVRANAIVDRSYFLNYMYWISPRSFVKGYEEYIRNAFANEAVLKSHLADMASFIRYAKERNVKLMVVTFPIFPDLALSGELLEPVEAFFAQSQVPLVSVGNLPEVANAPVEKLVVNANDAHASEWVHALVADKIYEKLLETGYLD